MDHSLLGAIIFAFCAGIAALIFIVLGIWALRRGTPMHFWSGTEVPPEEIADVPAYNRANAAMWLVYGTVFIGLGVLAFFHMTAAAVGMLVACAGGLPTMIFLYKRIFLKYKAPGVEDSAWKKP